MKKLMLRGFLAAMLVISLLAPPAVARVNGVMVYSGTMALGEDFWPDCDKHGRGEAQGDGLYLMPELERDVHTWSYSGPLNFAGTGEASAGLYDGGMWLCGWMDGPLPGVIGASCLGSKGYHGRGTAPLRGDPTGRTWLKFFNVGWKVSAGGVMVVTGNYQVYQYGGPEKWDKAQGSIYGLATYRPEFVPEDCIWQRAEYYFPVIGTAALVQDDQDHGKADDMEPLSKRCGNTWGDDACPEPGPGK